MSIGEQVSYIPICDICDEAPDDTGFPSREEAIQSALDAGWICAGDLVICQRCDQKMSEPDPLQLNMFPEIAP